MDIQKAKKIMAGFERQLQRNGASVFSVQESGEKIILHKEKVKHIALCTWKTGAVTGYFPYALMTNGAAMGCRTAIHSEANSLTLCIAAPSLSALDKALEHVRNMETEQSGEDVSVRMGLKIWVRKDLGEAMEISELYAEPVGS